MSKTTFLAIFAVAVLLIGTIAGPIGLVQSADALKSKGNSASQINSKKVCGDRLCSEVPKEKPVESKNKEQVKSEKKAQAAEKAKEAPKKDTKAETMDAAKAAASTQVPKTVTGVITSQQDPGVGHEEHQLAILLAPRDKAYSGHLTFDASEPVQIVTLFGPIEKGQIQGMPYWTPDDKTYYALSVIPTKAAGSTQFSGNALALHTFNSDPFTVSYSIVLTNPIK